ncbi:Lipid-A-disaccharide synthase [Moraxella caviae]|nr:Lipid-A-disaccharide synthase [Moraxella caviae]
MLADALKPYDTLGILGKSNTPKLNAPQICVMAGSRTSEISAILPTLLASLERLSLETPIGDELRDFCAVLPVISREHAKLVAQLVATHTPALAARLQVIYDDGNFTKPYGLNISQTAMAASDITVLASGTATLEAMLLHAPMVVVYKVAPVTYAIAKRLVKVPYVSLPNILANANPAFGSAIVPELLQHAATPKNIASHIAAVRQSEQADNLAKLSELTRNLSAQDPATAVMAHYHKQQSNHT